MKKEISVDLKHYGRILDKLIRIYNVMYGLNGAQFIERFWSVEVIEILRCYDNDDLRNKLLNIDSIKDLSKEVKSFEKLAICLNWKCQKACRYLLREILKMVYYEIKAIEKVQDSSGRYRAPSRMPKFVHPMYEDINQVK